ncbi:hypothetical protein FNV43_RR21591 [Rhamnella rubrinervis]|uniref:Uncharacterized protein n=1 Tax=Rhamnella rubrinervis TaxID=2594499 RepID=A0A8K0DTG5_9ROSA|nr:hypothetical protein FNV43_RR21591 [Rhamnella rubrinervis]
MGISKISTKLIICMLGFLAQLQFSHGQNAVQDYLKTHNSARAAVGVGHLTWSNTVADYAKTMPINAKVTAGWCILAVLMARTLPGSGDISALQR